MSESNTYRIFERMSTRKRNEFLEDDETDEDVDHGYDSDAAEESRGAISGRASKRRRFEVASDDESFDGIEDDAKQEDAERTENIYHNAFGGPQASTALGNEDRIENEEGASKKQQGVQLKPSTPKQVAAAQKAARRSGVIYISRVPPFMKPQTLRHFLTPHASKGLGRIFLTPEDHAAHTRRVKSGGNKKKSFTDGWVEFVSKREAKIAAETLNGNIIGGKKGNFYHDDLWNMKYLKGFKWSHLTEQIANENAERAARMREEVRKTRQENKAFVEDVERGKMLETMEARKKARHAADGTSVDSRIEKKDGRPKEFKQKPVQQARKSEKATEQVSRMQSMIF